MKTTNLKVKVNQPVQYLHRDLSISEQLQQP